MGDGGTTAHVVKTPSVGIDDIRSSVQTRERAQQEDSAISIGKTGQKSGVVNTLRNEHEIDLVDQLCCLASL